MIKFKLIAYGIASALILSSCSEILEPVSLYGGTKDVTKRAKQEEFEINIKSLTFKTAKIANKAPYSRQLIKTGSGSEANVLDEANFLKSNFPKSLSNQNYLLGVGDQLSYVQLNEFETEFAQWPKDSNQSEYLLGPGDKLTFTQSNDSKQNISAMIAEYNDKLITTEGLIGSNGNILLFGLGNILAANRTLDSVRTEVRNILIRNGLAPNFQLEITEFQSQKAFITISNDQSRVVYLNNLPISLQEIALSAGLSESDKSFALIKLTRKAHDYRLTAGQLFDLEAPEIIIQDNDQINIEIILNESTDVRTVVGSKGNILLPNVGSIYALNRTVDYLHEKISNVLKGKGI